MCQELHKFSLYAQNRKQLVMKFLRRVKVIQPDLQKHREKKREISKEYDEILKTTHSTHLIL